KFDDGWDKYREKVFAKQKEMGIIPQNATLSRHDPDVQDWDKLPADEQRLYARMMEVFAGYLEHTDHHIGRLINFLESTGELDNTLIMLISDAKAESKHHTQYFEMMSNRSIYHDDGRDRWRAVCPFPGPSFTEAQASFGELALTEEKLRELDAMGWELYNLNDDPAETKNLADTRRDVLIEMIALWYSEAGKYKVFPLDCRGTARFAVERPQLTEERKTYVYYPHTQGVPENVAVKTLNRAFSLTAEVEIPKGGAEGVIICHGSNVGGYTFFIKDKKLQYVHNYVGAEEFHVESKEEVPEGKVELRFEFEPTGPPEIAKGKGAPGRAQLYINGKLVGQADFPMTIPLAIGIGGGLSVGRNPGAPVSQLYHPPFAFTGKIFKVTADVSGKMIQDKEEEQKAQAKAMMARQ